MHNKTISIFKNQIFLEIINEIKLFSQYKVKFYNNLNLCTKDAVYHDQLVIFFLTKANKKEYEEVKKKQFSINYYYSISNTAKDVTR